MAKKTWWDRIAEARERGHFTAYDVAFSYSWVTCACGEQDARIPRSHTGVPYDQQLAESGGSFYYYVQEHDFDSAEKTLRAIEVRAATLLREIEAAEKAKQPKVEVVIHAQPMSGKTLVGGAV